MTNQRKTCSKCGKTYPLNESHFARNQSTNTGGNKYWRPECKKCGTVAAHGKQAAIKEYMRDRGLRTIQEFKNSRPSLGTPCDNCSRVDKNLCFDHCHKTYVHRGWLCDNCNRSIGMLGDDIAGLKRALEYVQRTETNT